MINRIKKYRKLRSDGLILPIKYENLHRRCEELLGGDSWREITRPKHQTNDKQNKKVQKTPFRWINITN